MASSAAMQSILGSSVTRLTGGSRVNQLSTAKHVTMSKRHASFRVRATAEEENKEQSPDSPTSLPKPQATPKPAPKASTKFTDVLAFSGPGPERINGRLAMVGFVSAIAVELANGNDLVAQISNGGIPWFLGTSVLLSLASLIPLLKGVTVESRSGGIMSSDAELWNGRLAMLGLIALAFTEYVKGGTLV